MDINTNPIARAARQLSMIAAVLLLSCTNHTAETDTGLTAISIGNLQVGTQPTTRTLDPAPWADGDLLTVLATPNALTNTYRYTAEGTWVQHLAAAYYLDDVLDPATTFHATKGTEALVIDQATPQAYHQADYIAGAVDLDVPNRQFVTPAAAPLTHQHVDVVLTITQGDGWATADDFTTTLSTADIKLYTADGTAISPYRAGATRPGEVSMRGIIPLTNLPAAGATIATLNLPGETAQQIAYTLTDPTATVGPGTRLNIGATYHNHRALTGITINVTGWMPYDEPELPAKE